MSISLWESTEFLQSILFGKIVFALRAI